MTQTMNILSNLIFEIKLCLWLTPRAIEDLLSRTRRICSVERKDTLRLYDKSTVGWSILSKMPYNVSTKVFGVIVITPLKQTELCRLLYMSDGSVLILGTV